jgi:prolyl 4-hydroxylase
MQDPTRDASSPPAPPAPPAPPGRSQTSLGRLTRRSQIHIPNATRLASEHIELYTLPELLDEDECRYLLDLMQRDLHPSQVMSEGPPQPDVRTSQTCNLRGLRDPLAIEVELRIARLVGIDVSYSEGLQGHLYQVGQEFKPHMDAVAHGASHFASFTQHQGQRTWTVMVFLNDAERGGGTRFPHLDQTFQPRRGLALIWNNLDAGGAPNPYTMHQGLPVEAGYKAVLTVWFRGAGDGRMFVKELNEYLPCYTPVGFARRATPPGLQQRLLDYYRAHRHEPMREGSVTGIESDDGGDGSELVPLPEPLRREIHATLQPICEQWCGEPLEPTYVYGLRVYHHGARLRSHRDRIATHIISAILNIDQETNTAWPLEIDDHAYRRHRLTLQPGDMVLYEGGRLRHGRPEPLDGGSYCNVFVHYRPTRPATLATPASDLDLIPRRIPGYQIYQVGGTPAQMALYWPGASAFLHCNLLAAQLLSLCDGQRTIADCIEELRALYPEAAERVADDVGRALATMVRVGAVETV